MISIHHVNIAIGNVMPVLLCDIKSRVIQQKCQDDRQENTAKTISKEKQKLIIELVTDGFLNSQISEKIGDGLTHVSNYITNVIYFYGIRNRNELWKIRFPDLVGKNNSCNTYVYLITEGLTTAEIAEKMEISAKDCDQIISLMRRKCLHIKSRAAFWKLRFPEFKGF